MAAENSALPSQEMHLKCILNKIVKMEISCIKLYLLLLYLINATLLSRRVFFQKHLKNLADPKLVNDIKGIVLSKIKILSFFSLLSFQI